jgi:hypothetical protein
MSDMEVCAPDAYEIPCLEFGVDYDVAFDARHLRKLWGKQDRYAVTAEIILKQSGGNVAFTVGSEVTICLWMTVTFSSSIMPFVMMLRIGTYFV